MTWSWLSQFRAVVGTGEAQRREPGENAVDNCGPACGAAVMMAYGYSDIEPQAWINWLFGPHYRGPTAPTDLNRFIDAKYPNPPRMQVVTVADPMPALATWARQGFLAIGLFNSDAAAVIKPYRTGILHFAIPLEDDGSAITVWNPEWATYDRLDYRTFRAAQTGMYDVCQRSLEGIEMWNQGQKVGLMHETIKAIYQREPTQQELFDQVAALHDNGDNFADIVQSLSRNVAADPQARRWGNPQLLAALDRLTARIEALEKSQQVPATAPSSGSVAPT